MHFPLDTPAETTYFSRRLVAPSAQATPNAQNPMPRKGAVVSNAGRHAVVWDATPSRYLILPIDAGAPRTRADVVITTLVDRIACYCFGPSHVRAGVLLRVPAAGQDHTGDVSPALLALIASARARVEQDARWADKWGDDRRHRAIARMMVERV